MNLQFSVLDAGDAQRIHDASVAVLERAGMRFESESFLDALERAGAAVDRATGTARIPSRVVERVLESGRALLRAGRRLHLLNGVTSEMTGGTGIAAKISGGCESYLDGETGQTREATADELLRCIRIGELIPEVAFVGNPIVLRRDHDGTPIEERMRRIRTAALVAKHTRKVGSMEVWSPAEVEFLAAIGEVARGGAPAYAAAPCLVTAKETISPLFLDRAAGDVLFALAARGLPCTIIPMPISGMSAPVTPLGNAIVANAEILGVMAAIRSMHPEALVGGGSISGVLDMRTSVVSFSAPEAMRQDLAVAEVHEQLYGQNYLVGTGYTDSVAFGGPTLAEKARKFLFSRLARRPTYPVGLLKAGSVFSAEQALVDLDLCGSIHAGLHPLEGFADTDRLVQTIVDAGPRGGFLESDHTLEHFRDGFSPRILDTAADATELRLAANAWLRDLLAVHECWQIDEARSREIDRIVAAAERTLKP